MSNEIFRQDELAIELIASGSTIDDDPRNRGGRYRISTWTFRMNDIGQDRWWRSKPVDWSRSAYPYDTEEEFTAQWKAYEAKLDQRNKAREALTADIAKLLGIPEGSRWLTIYQTVSEIYTAVLIQEVEPEAPRKKITTAEFLQHQLSVMNAMLCCLI